MLILLSLPTFGPAATTTIRSLHAAEGTVLPPGSKLLDITVDLSAGTAEDCPPVSHYRVVLRDHAWLRRWMTRAGDQPAAAAPLALLSTHPDDDLTAPPARAARTTVAGILLHDGWDP